MTHTSYSQSLVCFCYISTNTEKVHCFYFNLCVVTVPELVQKAFGLCTNFWRCNGIERDIMCMGKVPGGRFFSKDP